MHRLRLTATSSNKIGLEIDDAYNYEQTSVLTHFASSDIPNGATLISAGAGNILIVNFPAPLPSYQ
jgi:hypothetical protein